MICCISALIYMPTTACVLSKSIQWHLETVGKVLHSMSCQNTKWVVLDGASWSGPVVEFANVNCSMLYWLFQWSLQSCVPIKMRHRGCIGDTCRVKQDAAFQTEFVVEIMWAHLPFLMLSCTFFPLVSYTFNISLIHFFYHFSSCTFFSLT